MKDRKELRERTRDVLDNSRFMATRVPATVRLIKDLAADWEALITENKRLSDTLEAQQ